MVGPVAYLITDGNRAAGQTIPTPEWLTPDLLKKDYLFGLPLLSTEFGTTMELNTLARYINRAVSKFERDLMIKMDVKRIRCNGEAQGLTQTVMKADGTVVEGDFEIEEEPYDWHPEDFGQGHMTLKLRQGHVRKVHRVELRVPNGQKLMEYPAEWLHLTKKSGLLRIVPYGTNAGITYPVNGYPLAHMSWANVMPGAFWVDYDAGMDLTLMENADIADMCARFAAIMALDVSGDAFLPGVSSYSVSLDGLSESLSQTSSPSFAAFGARRAIYATEITEWVKENRDRLRGLRFTVL
jgi:hypothetical protein